MRTFDIETHRPLKLEMNDDQLIGIIDQRLSYLKQYYRIHNGVFQKYYRVHNSIMFQWHDYNPDDKSELIAYKTYLDTMTTLKQLLKDNR